MLFPPRVVASRAIKEIAFSGSSRMLDSLNQLSPRTSGEEADALKDGSDQDQRMISLDRCLSELRLGLFLA